MFSNELINKFQPLETPFYYYDLSLLKSTLEACKTASAKYNFHVHYALKANFDARVLETIRSFNIGADCVSGGEVKRAIETGFSNKAVVFAGVGKSDAEINYALDQDIFCFNVESIQELEVINGLAAAKGKTAKVALRINPNVNAYTHKYITTGLEENKFGINQWEFDKVVAALKKLPNIQCLGLHFHIGSQITDLNVFKSLCIKVNEIVTWFREHHVEINVINVGGGLGVDYYHPDTKSIIDFETYFKIFDSFLERSAIQEVHFELGRALVANCGSLISRVLYVKNGQVTNFAILDAGMTELMRPALYQAYHKIENISKANSEKTKNYDVVGPICESTDCFAKAVELPETHRGDLIAIRTAGAYGEVMASNYNLRDKVKAVYGE
ncbi:diaminopimelate decarboxylase [Solitalea sp. MAHUQ-68]|uniref:Diaminopimelate decarboxylase n=1 Tax=Solitalea agri TaxID=2953739 RepID=A0A9X2F325_9SPHI|nr:diaminopimelate decarboxylase [Solitalea agri]MCO4293727.1 diaminopimelate decarboxylase [Solitalea agri]